MKTKPATAETASQQVPPQIETESLLANDQDLICVFKPSGKVIKVNDLALQYLSEPTEENPVKVQDWLDPIEARQFEKLVERLEPDAEFSGVSNVTLSPGSKHRLFTYSIFYITTTPEPLLAIKGHFTTPQELHHTSKKEKEESFRGIFEHSSEAIIIFDQYLTCLDLNSTFVQLSQYEKENLIGHNLKEKGQTLFSDSRFQEIVKSVWSSKKASIETTLITRDNNQVPVELAIRVAHYFGQRVLIASVRDISERKREEEEIHQRNRQLEFFNSLLTQVANCGSALEVYTKAFNGIVGLKEVKSGALYCLSETEEKAFLTKSESCSHLALPETIDVEEVLSFVRPDAIEARLFNHLKRRVPFIMASGAMVVPFISEDKLKAFLLLYSGQTPSKAVQLPSLLRFVASGISSYISRTHINQQLSQTESKYKALFEMAQDAILLLDAEVIVESNPAGAALLGLSKNKLVGRKITDFTATAVGHYKDLDPKKLRTSLRECLNTGNPENLVWIFSNGKGAVVETEITISRVLLLDRHFLQAIIRDKTAEHNSQRAAQRALVLNESNTHLRKILSNLNLCSVGLSTSGRILYCNNLFVTLSGYSQQDLIGEDFFQTFFHGEQYHLMRSEFLNCIRNRNVNESFEKDILTKEGEYRTLHFHYVLDYNDTGELTGVSCIGHDITEGKIAIEALHDNRLQMQDLIDNAHDLIHKVDVQNRFMFTNRAWQTKLGYSAEELEQMVITDLVHPDYRDIFQKQIQNLFQGRQRLEIETVFLTSTGEPVYLQGSISCQYYNHEPVATRAILHDVTERIKADRIQRVYYSIANLAISSSDLQSLYKGIHSELGKIIDTTNIYIALTDEHRTVINFPYLIDTQRPRPLTNHKRDFQSGLTEYIIHTAKPLLITRSEIEELTNKGLIQPFGLLPEVFMASPLRIGDRIIGVIAVQSATTTHAYTQRDLDVLHFISNQVALAIERKSNEEQINKQNGRLKAIFESGTHLMWSADAAGNLTSFNQNFSDAMHGHFGMRPVLGQRTDSNGNPFASDELSRFFDEKYADVFEGKPQKFVLNMPDQAGRMVYWEVFLNPIFLEDGSLEEISGMAHDITESKEAADALKKSEEKFRRIFESFQDVYYRTDMEGTVMQMSPSVQEVIGYRPDEVVGMHGSDFYEYPEDRELLLKTVLRHGKVRSFETSMKRKDGTVIHVVLNSLLIRDDQDRPIGIEGVLKDITELKETQAALITAKEEAENLLKVKSQFLANMSHELRTPMNGIIGMIELMAQTKMSAEQRDYTDTLRKSSDALLVILNDILDLSKIQAGKLEVNVTTIDLKVALDKIYSLFLNRALQKGLKLSFTVSPKAPRYIKTDETRLLQILSNLVSNAIKFTNTGEVSVHVMEAGVRDGEHELLFEVRDTGIGIKEESQHLLFNNFTQLDNSSSKVFSGTGLGLAISMQLTKLLGGDIGIRSSYGHGSTFWFTIRCGSSAIAAPEPLTLPPSDKNVQEQLHLNKKALVLLVDDNHINQKVAARMLEKIGCKVELADNGFIAINKATEKAYDYIFMDIQMPEMDGIETTRHIKTKLGNMCPPIIAMTAYSMKNDAERFMSQGLDDYISKPVSQVDLFKLLQRWENQQQPQRPEKKEPPKTNSVNLEIFNQLSEMGGFEFAVQLYTDFEDESEKLLSEIQKNLVTKNYREILSNLHQLKGTAATLGLQQLAAQAKKLEEDIKGGKMNSIGPDIDLLDNLFLEFKNSYRDLFNRI